MATYIEIDINDTSKVDFSQVNTTSSQTMRRNLANTRAIIAFDVEPSFITNGTLTPIQTMDHSQCLALLADSDWTPEEPE